ncbi:hypothetical protein PC116_g21596 [Phytophthora cactorum]|nr:hypothetical protein PC112_g17759 [Phytophthora cactorum]KAG2808789.1 hypothetical protein PC111_g16341 [Phytophthora cactorum]KAG2993392.1 hypothetical protein PC119_g18477 [Phytophthora cactorum]KAG3143228.1 hypothetical protein C6341_g19131 [Phytophthora cactorum]KAG4230100.1 hypothetical protein PC116_g21596 [Phytophthora cactorum]
MEQRREQLRTRSQQWHTQRGMELGELQQNKEDITVFGSYSRSSGNTGTGSVGVTCFGTKYLRACHQSYRKTTKLSERVDLALDSHTMSSIMTNCRSARCYDNEEGDVCYCRYKINTCEAGRTTVVYQQDMDLRGRAAEVPPMYYRCASIVKTVCSVRVHTKGMS